MKRNNQIELEPMTDKEIVDALLSNDPVLAHKFFYVQCKPLLSKIAWTLFNNTVSTEDLSNELYLLCREDDWHRLRDFSFKSSLFGWLRIVSTRHFIRNKEKFTNLIDSKVSVPYHKRVTFDNATDKEIEHILSQMASSNYIEIVRSLLKEKMSDDEVRRRLALTPNEYRKKKEGAFGQLVSVIRNEGHTAEIIFIPENKYSAPIQEEQDDSWTRVITKIDIGPILNLLENDRYRFVIESLVLQDRKREDVADELCTSIQNLDNIKSRALKKLAELVKFEMKNGRF